MLTARIWLTTAVAVLAGAAPASAALSDVPTPTVTGPIPVTATSHPFLGSSLDLAAHGYTEKEYYLNGDAVKYSTPSGIATSTKVLDGPNGGLYPYKTRIVVRRPLDPARFNGTTLLEWQNVTAGFDVEWNWFNDPQYLMDHGYAWVGVSAQRVGVSQLKTWNPSRYGDLDVSSTATPADSLSYDVFSQAAKAVRGFGGGRDPMAGLESSMIVASGESQSGSRLNSYYNAVQPVANVIDAFFITVATGTLRTDLPSAKVMRVLSEREITTRPATPEADTDSLRHWEIAGGSHLPFVAYANWVPSATRDLGAQSADCVKPALSKVQWPYVANRALDALVTWQKGGAAPANAPRAQYVSETTGAALQRNADGNEVGGIQLPALTVPVGTESSVNSAVPGSLNPFSAFCGLLGSSTPFDDTALTARYTDYGDYVDKVNAAAEALRGGPFLVGGGVDQIKADAADFTRLRPTVPALGVDSHAVNDGTFALTWRGPSAVATDTTYGLQAKSSAPAAAWTDVPGATAVAARSLQLAGSGPLAEGTYAFRVRGTTRTVATPVDPSRIEITPWSNVLSAITVDRTAPPVPSIGPDRAADWVGAGSSWFKDAATLTVQGNPDPPLADGSPGSGLAPDSLPRPRTRTTTGTLTVSGVARDHAGNASASVSRSVEVDADPPLLVLACPASAWVGDTTTATATAADGQSGLATPEVEIIPIDTATPGTRTTGRTATDHVGHSTSRSCSTLVRALPTSGRDGTGGAPGRDGTDGAPGRDGTDGASGRDGTNGTNGTNGAAGPSGRDGTTGPAGATGPAGRAANVTCKATGKKQIKVTCTVRLAKSARGVRLTLRRDGVRVASASAARSRTVSLRGAHALRRGRYTLTVTVSGGEHATTSRRTLTL